MKIATLPEKGHPLFLSKPPIKVEVQSSSPLLKIWLEAQLPPPPPPPQAGRGVHTMRRETPLICPSMVKPTRENVRLLKNFIFIDTSLSNKILNKFCLIEGMATQILVKD